MQQDWNCLRLLNYDSLSYKVQSTVLAITFFSNLYIIGDLRNNLSFKGS